MIEANWLAFTLAAIIAVLIALWLIGRGRKPRERSYRPDVLDEGVGPAQRNQALIDAPSASARVSASPQGDAIQGGPTHEHEPPAVPDTLAGMGTAVGAAVLAGEEEAAHAHEDAANTAPAVSEEPDAAGNGGADDLSRIKGVGPKLVALLGSLGVTRYDQIAEWSDADVERIDAQLGNFRGRIVRDNWVEQCRYLAADDVAGYEARFGKL